MHLHERCFKHEKRAALGGSMYESPERLNQILARWWRKILVTECRDDPDEWDYWEHTDASLREAQQSQESDDRETVIREAA
jgi:hypothetical protein